MKDSLLKFFADPEDALLAKLCWKAKQSPSKEQLYITGK